MGIYFICLLLHPELSMYYTLIHAAVVSETVSSKMSSVLLHQVELFLPIRQ